MVRSFGVVRLAAGLAVIPVAAALGAACGGNDTIDPSDASTPTDGAVHDGALGDARELDAKFGDTGSSDAASADADAGSPGTDSGLSDGGPRDADAGLDANIGLDAEAGVDAEAGRDAGDAGALLGSASNFAILASSMISITPTAGTTVSGDVGVSPGTSILTLPAGQPSPGTVFAGGPIAAQAQADLTTAYNTLAGLPCGTTLSGDLGGRTLPPGVYCYPGTSAGLTGALVLDAQGNPNARWVFQVGSTLTTGTISTVSVIGGGSACNVYWQIGSSATIGTGTAFLGNIVAADSISLVTGATILTGRALARTAAVTLDANRISNATCQ